MLQELADKLIREVHAEQRSLEERAETLRRDRAAFDAEKAKMSVFADSQKATLDIVQINVGGEVVATKRGTLLLAENTLLEAMFSGRWEDSLERDSAGRVFLDFSPVPFRALLSHLRVLRDAGPGTRVKFPGVPPEYQAEFDSMVKYLELWEFLYGKATCSVGALECKAAHETLALRVDVTDRGSKICGSGRSYTPLVGRHALLDVLDQAWWKISVEKLPTNGWLYAGIIGTEAPQQSSMEDATSYGWASNCIYQGGKQIESSRGWSSWQECDVAIFRLDARSNQLCMCLTRAGATHTHSLKLQEGVDVQVMRMHVNLQAQSPGVEVSVLPVTSAEAVNLSAASCCSF